MDYWDKRIETMDRPVLEHMQKDRLVSTLQRA